MNSIRDILLNNEPLLIFLVIGFGFLLGQIKIRGFSLGIAGVLFAGLGLGAWQPEGKAPFQIAQQIREVGLILFVYIVGLTSGPGFFASFKKRGIKFNLIIAVSLLLGAAATFFTGYHFKLKAGEIAGVFCGGLTNTPALAAVTQLAKEMNPLHISDPAVGYSLTYPYGVIGGLLAFHLFFKIFNKKFKEESLNPSHGTKSVEVISKNFEITNPDIFDKTIGELRVREKTGLIISRHKHGDRMSIPTKYTQLNKGDVVVAVGKAEDIKKAESYFGKLSNEPLDMNISDIDMRRILVSRRDIVGKTIRELEIDRLFNAQVTRLRRADIEMVPSEDMTLELGDRLRVVMPRARIHEVCKFFGDSERGIAELDYTAITIGISLGVLLGMLPIPLPGSHTVSLGFAGGPLLVGLVLGRIGRTGPLVWSIPLESRQALSHIGLLFFLAGVGISAGGHFFSALSNNGLQLLLLGILNTTISTLSALFLLKTFGKATVVEALGATSGMQTQPATLSCAYQLTQANETYIAYATTYPVSTIGKILIAQFIYIASQGVGL